MADWLMLLLAVLSVYRVARMLALEEGPLGIFAEIRGHIDPQQATWLGRGLNCPKCISYWVALLAALAITYLGGYWNAVLLALEWNAIAGGAIIIYSFADERWD